MSRTIPRILFAAPASGSGKTILTCAFISICLKRGLAVRAMKCGPDFIDPMFHQSVLGISGSNLDSFFLGEEGIRELLLRETVGSDIAVLEGVMGYYDGVAGIRTEASTYEIARITETPVILVIDAKAGGLSLAALMKGFQEFREDSRICGVILNRTGEILANRLRPQIEALGLHVAGWIPECEEARFESRHLGLVLPDERQLLQDKVRALADRIEAGLDMEWLLRVAGQAVPFKKDTEPLPAGKVTGKRIRMAVARDEVFCFYYQENLRMLQRRGAELVFFSPLHDTVLPEGTDAILFGGGYPELFAADLSNNIHMRAAVNSAAAAGVKILAESGGFLYLHQTLEGVDGCSYPMAGVLNGHGFRTKRLSRFGYITLTGVGSGSGAAAAAGSIKGHEFHYWDSDTCGDSCLAVKPFSNRAWPCMHRTETLLAGFAHLYYPSNPEWIAGFLFH